MSDPQGIPKFSLSRWFIALLVGVPVAVGTYYLLRKPRNQSLKDQTGSGKPENKKTGTNKVVVADETKEKKETPLDIAMKLKTSGNGFYKKGEYREAIRCYTEALSICPANEKNQKAALYQNRAASYEILKNLENVIDDCTEAIKLNPTYLKALARRYKAAEKLKQYRRALEDVTAVCIIEKFTNMESLASADRILKVVGEMEAEKYMKTLIPMLPSEYFMKAYFASFTQDPFSKNFPALASAELVLLRGIEKAQRALLDENYEDIIPACDEEIAKPSSPEGKEMALLLRASMYILSSQMSKAMDDLGNLIEITNDKKIKSNALLRRACLNMQAEEPERAYKDFDDAAEIDPTNPDVPHQRAQMFLLGERLEDAVAEFKKAAKLNPNSGLIHVQKLYAEYRYHFAEKVFPSMNASRIGLEEAIVKYPNTPEGYMLLAQVYNDTQEYEKAEVIFDAGIKADSKNASILVHKGILYLQWKGDTDSAVELLERAILIDPKSEFAYETLASIEVQRGKLMKAVTLFDKALPLAKSEREVSHILSLRAAAQAQIVVAQTLGLGIEPGLGLQIM